jgi:hypothetical protein
LQIQADEVFGWGSNYFGSLGLGDNANKPTPQPVPLAPALSGYPVSVCAGWYYSCVLDSNNDVACTGDDYYGQNGVGATWDDSNVLGVPTGVSSAVHLACGASSVLVTTATGSLMAWGNNYYGGLGLASVTAVWEAQVSCCLLYSFFSILELTECTDCGGQRSGGSRSGPVSLVLSRREPGRQVQWEGRFRAVGRRGGRFHQSHLLHRVWAPGYEHNLGGRIPLLRHAPGR